MGEIGGNLDKLDPETAAGVEPPLEMSEGSVSRDARRGQRVADSQGEAGGTQARGQNFSSRPAARSSTPGNRWPASRTLSRAGTVSITRRLHRGRFLATNCESPPCGQARSRRRSHTPAALDSTPAVTPSLPDVAVASTGPRVQSARPPHLAERRRALLRRRSKILALRVSAGSRSVAGGPAPAGPSEKAVAAAASRAHTLGASFNLMAERLAEARSVADDYQKMLESRVVERTQQLRHLAEHDPLTELPNRRQLFAQMSEALAGAAERGLAVGVMVLDLDNFKNINDTMAIHGGTASQEVAKRLESVVSGQAFRRARGGRVHRVCGPHAAWMTCCGRAGDPPGFSSPLAGTGAPVGQRQPRHRRLSGACGRCGRLMRAGRGPVRAKAIGRQG